MKAPEITETASPVHSPLSLVNPQAVAGQAVGPRPMKRKVSYSKWTYEEDHSLLLLVEQHGTKDWTKHGEEMKGRTGKQCRERYVNHLVEGIKKGDWTKDEEDLIVKQQAVLGNQYVIDLAYKDGVVSLFSFCGCMC